MDQILGRKFDYVGAVRRRLPVGVAVLGVLLLVTIALSMGLPAIYKSNAVILIEQQEVPQDFVRSLVTGYADQRIQMISQRVLTNSNLSSIIDKYNLYEARRKSDPLESVIKNMRDDISVEPISADVVDQKSGRPSQATIAFQLSYQSRSADMAQKVTNEIVSLFLKENLKERSETAAETTSFLTSEADKLGKQVADLETQLATFKEKNVNRLPELQNINLELMNGTQRELSELNSRIRASEEQRIYLMSELAQQKPTTTLLTETGERVLGPADRLKVLESQFVSLSARYGASHPDVVNAKKEMNSLRAETGKRPSISEIENKLTALKTQLAASQQKYSKDHPDIKSLSREIDRVTAELSKAQNAGPEVATTSTDRPDNPVYIQLQARLQAADADIRGLNAQRQDLQKRLAEFESRLASAPLVEKEYRALSRDYESAMQKYHEITAKKQEAEFAKNLESAQKGERFELIEPPIMPEQPDKPNRIAIGLLGLLLSLAGGIGTGTLAETLDSRIYGRIGVTQILGVAPLSVIPDIENKFTRSRRTRNRFLAAIAAVALIAIGLGIVQVFVQPLDVLFFRISRVMGF
ncbi:MAG: lipopolysaccharide biosynthesis protein [Gammaproteobacteria bacterium]|nr:lipopolysaccharide biosynthesis protein [Gammaproteobacteria bacterium]